MLIMASALFVFGVLWADVVIRDFDEAIGRSPSQTSKGSHPVTTSIGIVMIGYGILITVGLAGRVKIIGKPYDRSLVEAAEK